ncbi:MAG: hypothetical protein ACI8Q6_002899 [Granulosicoccus sp.]|jgi:hypothetical protein
MVTAVVTYSENKDEVGLQGIDWTLGGKKYPAADFWGEEEWYRELWRKNV